MMVKKRIQYDQLTELDPVWVRAQIKNFIQEDMPDGDVTTEATIQFPNSVTAKVIAREDFMFCGEQVLTCCFPGSCIVALEVHDGEMVKKTQPLASVHGPSTIILSHERVMLNLIQHLSGISTEVKKYMDLNLPKEFFVLDTRKTTPGLRHFEKYAVAVGGGKNHRLDLSSGILIKDNHLQAAGGIRSAVLKSRKQNWKNLPIELEVDTLDQVREGMDCGVDGFLLDNMSPEMVKKAVSIIRNHPGGEDIFIEASGGICYEILELYAWTGIDGVSMSAITTQAKAVDINLEII